MEADKQAQFIIDELSAACNSLGKIDENDGTYMQDRDCKPCLREILRYLNADNAKHTARNLLGSMNVIKSDLIPLMVQYCDFADGDLDLFGLILRICTNLTSSLHLLFDKRDAPADDEEIKERELIGSKLLRGLHGFKEAFASDEKIWFLLNVHLRGSLDEEVVFERLIILIRNILHIPVDSTPDLGFHCDFDIHDMCLHRMDKSGLLDTLLYTAIETPKGAEYCFHITEIIYLMLRDQNPRTIAMARSNVLKRKLEDDDVDKIRYQELRERNRKERKQSALNAVRSRHSFFTVNNCRSLGENPLITRRIIGSRTDINFDPGKTELRKAKNKKPLSSETFMKISDTNLKTSKVSYGLKVFCKKFVDRVFNNYMQQIKHNLIQKRAQENDESYYLWAIHFFSSFTRHLALPLDLISEILSTSTLHFIQILISSYQDKIKTEKKQFLDTSKRLHLALRAYGEILVLIKTIEDGSDFSNTVDTIKKNIFTELEYSTLLLNLFQQYDEPKHSEHYLTDLIRINSTFLELLEAYSCKHGTIDLNTFESSDSEPEEEPTQSADDSPKETSDDIANEIADDTLKEMVDDTSKGIADDTAKEIVDDSAREFVDDMAKETVDDSPQETVDAPKEVEKEPKKKTAKQKKSKKRKRKKPDFKTSHFVNRYSHPDVIKLHLAVLRHFESNEDETNLAIMKLFERIVYDCKSEVVLFQASLFRCLLQIMDHTGNLPYKAGFTRLCQHLTVEFGRMANKRRWMFQELLFWKTCSDAIEIENSIDPPAVIPISDELEPEAGAEAEAGVRAGAEAEAEAEVEPEHEESQPADYDSLQALRDELGSDSDDEDDGGVVVSRQSTAAPIVDDADEDDADDDNRSLIHFLNDD